MHRFSERLKWASHNFSLWKAPFDVPSVYSYRSVSHCFWAIEKCLLCHWHILLPLCWSLVQGGSYHSETMLLETCIVTRHQPAWEDKWQGKAQAFIRDDQEAKLGTCLSECPVVVCGLDTSFTSNSNSRALTLYWVLVCFHCLKSEMAMFKSTNSRLRWQQALWGGWWKMKTCAGMISRPVWKSELSGHARC